MICCQNVMALSLKIWGLYFQPLAFQQISKVIVFTAIPCHAWHPGPDVTLMISWRRQRMWMVAYLFFLQVSWSPIVSPRISKRIEFTATPCHVWHPGPDATLLIIWRTWRRWTEVLYLIWCTATQSPPPLGPCVLQVLCKLLTLHTVCCCCICRCSLCHCISLLSSPCTKKAS